uniref:Uncharacterized protein n=1 Tax=mine drainage metagenome TaxID=410659 RepID=E6QQL9_9ZZZZ
MSNYYGFVWTSRVCGPTGRFFHVGNKGALSQCTLGLVNEQQVHVIQLRALNILIPSPATGR